MKTKLLTPLLLLLFCACHKSSGPATDPYTGQFYIKATVNGSWYLYNTNIGFEGLGSTPEYWAIAKTTGGQYTISPTQGYNLNAVLYNAGNTVVLMNPSTPNKPEELFAIEPVAGTQSVNFKSAVDNKYFVLQYGLDASGNLIRWGFTAADKTKPCTPDFSGSFPSPVSTGCQFNFELVK